MKLPEALKYAAHPQKDEIALAISERWSETEKYYREYIPKKIDMIGKRLGEVIWKDGYKPIEGHFEYECEEYDKIAGMGMFCDVKMERTYAQRFYPLMKALEDTFNELENIKSKWWYKLFYLLGLV